LTIAFCTWRNAPTGHALVSIIAGDKASRRCLRRRCKAAPRASEIVFFFFSNRVGCIGSLLISAAVTLVLLLIFRVI